MPIQYFNIPYPTIKYINNMWTYTRLYNFIFRCAHLQVSHIKNICQRHYEDKKSIRSNSFSVNSQEQILAVDQA